MQSRQDKFISKINSRFGRFSNQRHLVALRNAMSSIMTLIIIGSIFMLIAQFPYKPFADWLDKIGVATLLNKASNSTFGIMGLLLPFLTAYNLGSYYKLDPISSGILSIASYILVTPFNDVENIGSVFRTSYFGASGMFVGIIVSFITIELYRILVQKEIVIKMPESVPPAVSKAFSAILPGFIICIIWIVIMGILRLFGIDNIHDVVELLITSSIGSLSRTLLGAIIIVLLQSFLWMFGIHGAQVTGPILEPLLLIASEENRIAYLAGNELPNIVTYEFLYNYVFTGGAGCVLALTICLIFFSKSKENRELAKIGSVPVLFQVAEPVLFGFPTILNFKMMIPFMLTPVVSVIITYLAMSLGFVGKPIGAVIPWTTPALVSGYLANGGRLDGIIIQIITIAVNALIYLPFFIADDREKLRNENSKENNKVQSDEFVNDEKEYSVIQENDNLKDKKVYTSEDIDLDNFEF